ncbi:hypothetical protein GOBAR_AA26153 [Gossypium barbadense]|uniref:Uncharacterized protein n=1 Tax=Gossypium barbadense TaxID=3634 RepID=A0A2P5WTU4_GOSBA|nr:hypothetical protein GOBAR_AA26153 [Gossypium barbadense]
MSNTTEQTLEWETLARAWVNAFPEAKPVNVSQVELWINSNFGWLPPDLQSMPRSELIARLLSIQNHLRLPSHSQEMEPSQPDLLPVRFQRTDQWIPVYSWLESLDTDEVVKSKDISDWLNENLQVSLQPSNNGTALKVQKDVAKKPAALLSNPLNNIPKDSDLYIAKRNEALRKYEM